VSVDGVRATTDALKVGGVVNVVASAGSRVEMVHEAIGVVEQVDLFGRTFAVAGQTVHIDPSSRKPDYGQRVAVSGLRRPDGVIVAKLIEALNSDGATDTGSRTHKLIMSAWPETAAQKQTCRYRRDGPKADVSGAGLTAV